MKIASAVGAKPWNAGGEPDSAAHDPVERGADGAGELTISAVGHAITCCLNLRSRRHRIFSHVLGFHVREKHADDAAN